MSFQDQGINESLEGRTERCSDDKTVPKRSNERHLRLSNNDIEDRS